MGIQGWEFTGKGNAQVTQIAGEKSLEADPCPQPEAPLARPILDNSVWLTEPSAEHKDEAIARLRARFNSLTQREREVMAYVVAGRLNKQIAGDIGVSEITVKVHRGSLMRKMEAASVVDLVLMAEKLKASGDAPAP